MTQRSDQETGTDERYTDLYVGCVAADTNGGVMCRVKSKKRVAVIGSGIAGLVTAKVLLHDGFDVVVFEKDDGLGGTWAPARSYPGLRTNNSKYTYAFSDYPYPAAVDAFPVADNVRDYLNGYADHFHIRERIRFNSRVVTINTSGESGEQFQVTVAFRRRTSRR